MKQGKFWGETQEIFNNLNVEIHHLSIKKGGYSSEHKHKHKWNRFFIISGELKIRVFRDNGVDETILTAGQFTDVAPGVFHQFDAISDCECIEIYWVEGLDSEDIERRSVGGLGIHLMGLGHVRSIEPVEIEMTYDKNMFDPSIHEQSK